MALTTEKMPSKRPAVFHIGLFSVLWAAYTVLLFTVNGVHGATLVVNAITGVIVAAPAFIATTADLVVYRQLD